MVFEHLPVAALISACISSYPTTGCACVCCWQLLKHSCYASDTLLRHAICLDKGRSSCNCCNCLPARLVPAALLCGDCYRNRSRGIDGQYSNTSGLCQGKQITLKQPSHHRAVSSIIGLPAVQCSPSFLIAIDSQWSARRLLIQSSSSALAMRYRCTALVQHQPLQHVMTLDSVSLMT